MDRSIKQKPWYLHHRRYIAAGVVLLLVAGYTLTLQFHPLRQQANEKELGITEVCHTDFLEYIEQDGAVLPLLSLKVNSRMGGTVQRIVAEEGTFVGEGDTLLVLTNPTLQDEVAEQQEALEKQLISYRQQEIEMEQQSLKLHRQSLQNQYNLQRLADSYQLSQEEARMGIRSKAELEVARQEYEYKSKEAELERQGLKHDSTAATLRRQLIEANRQQDIRKYHRIAAKCDQLIVRAPTTGQFSSLRVELGQQIGEGTEVGEVKTPNRFKVRITPAEYYIDRITAGQPARATHRGTHYAMLVRRVVGEVLGGTFIVELAFVDSVPPALRLGQSIRTQIELDNASQSIVVPRGDFYAATGGQWIFRVVPGENRAVRVPIRLGRQNPRQYEVLEGLQPGDLVITTGYPQYAKAEEIQW